MPIFDEDSDRGDLAHDPPPSQPIPIESPSQTLRRKCSEESIRTDLCEGMLPDSPDHENRPSELISDRAELIERLKRGESPTWVPNRHRRFESLFFSRPPPPPHTSPRSPEKLPPLLPAANITPKRESPEDDFRLKQGLEIERPGSALHSGDFREPDSSRDGRDVPDKRRPCRSEDLRSNTPWTYATSPPRNYAPFRREPTFETPSLKRQSGPPSLSSSLSSSFAFQPPTSPLVQSESNDDLGLQVDGIELTEGNSKIQPQRQANLPRRHTLTSHSSYGFSTPTIPSQRSAHRRQGSYQAHQPQRSLTNAWGFQSGSPQAPAFLRPRRPSFSSDISPIQHASMVGSYEESILRGRMSTTPSKPLDFLAQIGVLGIGSKCKTSLRCPPHVTLPFPAVFYSYSNTLHGRSKSEDEPSPYVGQIDLENGLPNSDAEQRMKRKIVSRRAESKARGSQDVAMGDQGAVLTPEGPDFEPKHHRTKRRSGSPKCPPGGSYRIPETGQIQIIIKNPNKTAVKLFLVPYDLSGMEPGTKTFIRQRSYSAGPIIENIPASGSDKPTLRYLVHLHICCLGRGRYYLYKSIRVVFANRVPDGKEKLRNEVTYPEPRFSPYKPVRAMNPPFLAAGSSGAGATLAMDKAFRRRSAGFSLGNGHLGAGASRSPLVGFGGSATSGFATPIEPIPFRLPSGFSGGLEDSSETSEATGRLLSSPPPAAGRPEAGGNFLGFKNPQAKIHSYDKLSKGDVGYGGNAFYSQALSGSPGTEGLLSKRLRSLEMQQQEMEKAVDGNSLYFDSNGEPQDP